MTQTPQEESVRQDGRDTGPDTKDLRDGARRPRRQGLPIERVFSEPGRHPYDTVTWERRDVVQSNWKTGETVFEQKGVEFPTSWSVNASTIVTTKYFRGALGTDKRENSLRALIKYLEDINNVDILKLEVPNAQAIVYDFDQELNIVDKMITN